MKKFYLLSAVLAAQMFCFVGENCSANTEDLSAQPKLGKDILELSGNGDH